MVDSQDVSNKTSEKPLDQGRRNFLKLMIVISAGAAAAGVLKGAIGEIIAPQVGLTAFPTLQIVDTSGKPIVFDDLPVNTPTTWLFYYPLSNDPNFLIKLGDINGKPLSVKPSTVTIPADQTTYVSPGGVGPEGMEAIVSFSAICQHLGCIPPEIHYYPPGQAIPGTSYGASDNLYGIIHCSCHGSTYDPYHGAAVLTGPTSRPLPTTILRYNSDGTISAVSMIGPTIYGKPSDLTGGNPFPPGQVTTVVENTGEA